MILDFMQDEVVRLAPAVPKDRFPITELFKRVRSYGINASPLNAKDEEYRPAYVNLQAAFEFAASAHMQLAEKDLQWTGVVHTSGLIKPLGNFPSAVSEGFASEIYNDPARFDTVRVRAEGSLPEFMSAGGILISAATSLELSAEQQKNFDTHKQHHGDNLRVHQLKDLPSDMSGASYFLKGDSSESIRFVFIRAQQSDKTGPMQWVFGMGDPKGGNLSIRSDYEKTLEFLDANGVDLDLAV